MKNIKVLVLLIKRVKEAGEAKCSDIVAGELRGLLIRQGFKPQAGSAKVAKDNLSYDFRGTGRHKEIKVTRTQNQPT